MNAAGTEVPQAPQDTISSLTFGTVQNVPILIAGSWNKSVSVWTITPQGIAPAAVTEHDAPVLSVQFDDATGLVVSAGCDNTVRAWDVNTNQSVVIGQHASAIKDCRVVPAHNVIATGGWDNAVRFWDVRSQTKQPVMEIPLPGKVYSMDASGNILVTAMDKQMFGVLDIRSPGAFAQQGTSPHEFQVRFPTPLLCLHLRSLPRTSPTHATLSPP
jgi:WD40 repeat protein